MEDSMIKKGASLKDTFLIIILGIFCVGTVFFFVGANADESGVTVDAKYNDSYNQLQDQQDLLSDKMDDLRNLFTGVDEAQSGSFGYFGLTGVVAIMKAPIQILNIAFTSLQLSYSFLDFIPTSALIAITLTVTCLIIFAITNVLLNRTREI